MFCQKCGTQNSDDSNFCSKCGSSLKLDKEIPEVEISTAKTQAPIFDTRNLVGVWNVTGTAFGLQEFNARIIFYQNGTFEQSGKQGDFPLPIHLNGSYSFDPQAKIIQFKFKSWMNLFITQTNTYYITNIQQGNMFSATDHKGTILTFEKTG